MKQMNIYLLPAGTLIKRASRDKLVNRLWWEDVTTTKDVYYTHDEITNAEVIDTQGQGTGQRRYKVDMQKYTNGQYQCITFWPEQLTLT